MVTHYSKDPLISFEDIKQNIILLKLSFLYWWIVGLCDINNQRSRNYFYNITTFVYKLLGEVFIFIMCIGGIVLLTLSIRDQFLQRQQPALFAFYIQMFVLKVWWTNFLQFTAPKFLKFHFRSFYAFKILCFSGFSEFYVKTKVD